MSFLIARACYSDMTTRRQQKHLIHYVCPIVQLSVYSQFLIPEVSPRSRQPPHSKNTLPALRNIYNLSKLNTATKTQREHRSTPSCVCRLPYHFHPTLKVSAPTQRTPPTTSIRSSFPFFLPFPFWLLCASGLIQNEYRTDKHLKLNTNSKENKLFLLPSLPPSLPPSHPPSA